MDELDDMTSVQLEEWRSEPFNAKIAQQQAEIERLRADNEWLTAQLYEAMQEANGHLAAWDVEHAEIERLRSPRFEVVQLQPDEDSPGLWIGFETAAQRAEAMKLFALKDTTP